MCVSTQDAGSVNRLLSLWGFVDDWTFLTKAGHVGMVYRLRTITRCACWLAGNCSTLLWQNLFAELQGRFAIPSSAAQPYLAQIHEPARRYPRGLAEDLELLRSVGANFVLCPSESDLYPDAYEYRVTELALSRVLEGAHLIRAASEVAKNPTSAV